jgi:hypothetical protein
LIEEKDVEVYRKKLGIGKNVDLENADIDELLSEAGSSGGSKKKKVGYA